MADFSLVADAAQAALEGRQLQPVLLGPAALPPPPPPPPGGAPGPFPARPAISARKSMEHGTSLCYTVDKARMSCLPSGTGRTRRSLTWIAA